MQKIIRTITLFRKNPQPEDTGYLQNLAALFKSKGYIIQTLRLCSPQDDPQSFLTAFADSSLLLSIGSVSLDFAKTNKLLDIPGLNFNIGITSSLTYEHVDFLFESMLTNPKKTFDFTFVLNNPNSSPFYPSANYERDGFAIGLQATDLSQGCASLSEWFANIQNVWQEICALLNDYADFLGIDSSVAPLNADYSSLVNLVKRLHGNFDRSFSSSFYTQITNFIKSSNPKPVGLNGLMLPCLEDFELATEYEQGNFTIERNIFVSLHSGLGIDTYPIGIDEEKTRVLEAMQLLQALSNKYTKPLSARFVSDGLSRIGEKSKFENQYLKDVVIRKL